MRKLMVGAAAWLVLGAASLGMAQEKPFATMQKFIDSFNKGDAAAAAATHSATADLAIVDEVAPFLWNGPQAFQTWAADLDSDAKKNGITDQNVAISAPTRSVTSADRAYLVVPAVYTFKQRGVAMREKAQMTVVLKKDASGWLIHGWTWTGPNPTPAPAAKP